MTSKSNLQKKVDRFDAEVRRWDAAMQKGQVNEALGHAATALQIAVSKKDRALQRAASIYAQTALAQSEASASGKIEKVECSFCGRNRNQARLLVGANGTICEHCTEKASHFFVAEASSLPSKKRKRNIKSKD
jgi:formylmethanofuran dehydrogenase subunit E